MACSSLHTYHIHGLCDLAPGVTIPITAEVCRIQIATTDQHNRAIHFLPADLRDRIFRRPGVRRLSILQVLLQDVLQGTLLSRIIRDVEASLHRVERRQLRALGIPAHVRNRRCDHNRQHKHHRQHEPLCHHGCTRRYEGNRRRPVRRAADVLTALPETRHRVS